MRNLFRLYILGLMWLGCIGGLHADEIELKVGIVDKGAPYLTIDEDGLYGGYFGRAAREIVHDIPGGKGYVTGSERELVEWMKLGRLDCVVGVVPDRGDMQVLASLPFLRDRADGRIVRYGVAVSLDRVELFYVLNKRVADLTALGRWDQGGLFSMDQNVTNRPHETLETIITKLNGGLMVAGGLLAIIGGAVMAFYLWENRKRKYVAKIMDALPMPLAIIKKVDGMICYLFTNRMHGLHRNTIDAMRSIQKTRAFTHHLSVSYDMVMQMEEMVSFDEKQGEDGLYRIFLSPCVYDEEKVLVKSIDDIGEEVKLTERATNNDRLMDAFIESISHEVRTPLNSILGFSQMLPELPMEDRAELMEVIDEKSVLLEKLITDLLLLSKMEAGVFITKSATVDLLTIVEHILLRVRKKGVMLKDGVEMYRERGLVPIQLNTDVLLLRTVLENALNNAIKFTQNGAVRVGYFTLKKYLVLYVKDSGIGIQKEEVVAMCEPFSKVDTFTQGTGLGMTLMVEAAKMMNAQIGMASEVGNGTTVFLKMNYEGGHAPCEYTELIDEMNDTLWID